MRKLAVFVTVLCLSLGSFATDKGQAADRMEKAGKVISEIMAAPDKGIPEEVLDGAKCIGVVPNLVKAGFVFGGQHGEGVVTCRNAGKWSAPALFKISGGSWGAQIGAESIDLVMVFMNEKGANQLLNSKFKIGGDISGSAGPVGRHASAGTDWKLDSEILTYSRSKGLFAGLTLNGSVVQIDDDGMAAVYGANWSVRKALTGKEASPAMARPFVAAIQHAKTVARNR